MPEAGSYIAELPVEQRKRDLLKTRVKITNSKFTVPIKDMPTYGQIRGEIQSDGTLLGSGEINQYSRHYGATFAFSTLLRDGVFSAKGYLQVQDGGDWNDFRSKQTSWQYRITLTRATDAAR